MKIAKVFPPQLNAFILFSIASLFTIQPLWSQQKQSYTQTSANFTIKKRSMLSQAYADSFASTESDTLSKWQSSISEMLPPPPPLPEIAVFDEYKYSKFIVRPDFYVLYDIPSTCDNDSLSSRSLYRITKINRSDLSTEKFVTKDFKVYKGKLDFGPVDTIYEILETDYDTKRTIAGYECYQITLKRKISGGSFQNVILFVSDAIALNYHPVFYHEEILRTAFPLYVKFFNPDFPEDNYKEYTFHN